MNIPGDNSQASETTSPAPALPQSPQAIFFGPHGLRAGWRLAFYLCLYTALRYVVFFAANPISGPDGRLSPLWALVFNEFLLLVIAVVPALLMCRLEKRPFGTYGLPRQGAFGKNFWAGTVWGLFAIAALVLAMRVVGVVSFDGFAIHGIRMLKFAAFWGFMFLLVGFREEFLFRGYSLFTLTDGIGFWPAVLVVSCYFGYAHRGNSGESWLGLLGVVVIGLFFCLTVRRTGTLWFAVGMHAAWDWSETFLYSVPDSGLVLPGHLLKASTHGPAWLSGGSVGPEGSLLLFLLIAVMWVAFDRVYPNKKYPPHTEERPIPEQFPTPTSNDQ